MQERIDTLLAQETLNEEEIAFLLKNAEFIGQKGRVRLGLEAPKVEAEEVKAPKAPAKKITKKK